MCTYKLTTIVSNFCVQSKWIELLNKIRHIMHVPEYGLVFYFDGWDYLNHPYDLFRSMAFHKNVLAGANSLGRDCPKDIREIIQNGKYSNLIWVSKKACEKTDIHFSFTLAHEIRHLKQDLYLPMLSIYGDFLMHFAVIGINIEEKIYHAIDNEKDRKCIAVPTELDAQLEAWRLCKRIYGQFEPYRYIKEQINKKNQSFFGLDDEDPENKFDVLLEMISLFSKLKIKIIRIQGKFPTYSILEPLKTFRDINIDEAINLLRQTHMGKGFLKSDVL